MLLAAGAAWLENWISERNPNTRKATQRISWSLLVVGAIIGIILTKPIAPINSPLWNITSAVNDNVVEMVGWQDLTQEVAGIYSNIPDNESLILPSLPEITVRPER